MIFHRTILAAVFGLFLTFKAVAQPKIIVMAPPTIHEKANSDPIRMEAGFHLSPMINLANDGFSDDPMKFMSMDFGLTLDWLKEESTLRFGTGITYLSRSIDSKYRQLILTSSQSYAGNFKVVEIPLFVSLFLGELEYLKSYLKVGLLCDFMMQHAKHEVTDRFTSNGYEVIDKSYGPGNISESGYRFFNAGFYLGACQDYELSDRMVLRWDWSLNLHRFKNDREPNEFTAWFMSPGIRIGLAYNIAGLRDAE